MAVHFSRTCTLLCRDDIRQVSKEYWSWRNLFIVMNITFVIILDSHIRLLLFDTSLSDPHSRVPLLPFPPCLLLCPLPLSFCIPLDCLSGVCSGCEEELPSKNQLMKCRTSVTGKEYSPILPPSPGLRLPWHFYQIFCWHLIFRTECQLNQHKPHVPFSIFFALTHLCHPYCTSSISWTFHTHHLRMPLPLPLPAVTDCTVRTQVVYLEKGAVLSRCQSSKFLSHPDGRR